jgi:hypothetical protein
VMEVIKVMEVMNATRDRSELQETGTKCWIGRDH